MSIWTYFKPKDGLPNPKGPLSQSIPSQAIAVANIEVVKATGTVQKIEPSRLKNREHCFDSFRS